MSFCSNITLLVCLGFAWLLGGAQMRADPINMDLIALGQRWPSKEPLATAKINVSDIVSTKSMFEFRTFDPEGLVFYGDTEHGWFFLGLRGGIPEIQMTEGDAISYTWGGPKLNDGHWHKVEVENEESFVKLKVNGSLVFMVGVNSLTGLSRRLLRGQMRLSLGAILMEQDKLYHPLVLPMDGCLAKGNWLNQTNLWEMDTKLDAKLCLGDIRRGSHFSGRGLVVFNTSDSHSLPLPPLPPHLSSQGDIIVEIVGDIDIKGLNGSLLNIQTHNREPLVTVISKEEELVVHLGAEVHTLPLESGVETLALMFSEHKVLVLYGPKSVHFDLKDPQDWRSQWTKGLFLTFGGVPDASFQHGSDYLLGCVRRIKVQDRDLDLDRALYKDNSISSHSCPHRTAK